MSNNNEIRDTILVLSGVSLGVVWVVSSFIYAADANCYGNEVDTSRYDYVDKQKSKFSRNMKTYAYSLLWPFSSMYRNWKKME